MILALTPSLMTRAPGGPGIDGGPVLVGGQDSQRDPRPDEDVRLGLAELEYHLNRQLNLSMAKPREQWPRPGQLRARAAQDLDATEYFENKGIAVGLSKDELTEKWLLTGRRNTFSI